MREIYRLNDHLTSQQQLLKTLSEINDHLELENLT